MPYDWRELVFKELLSMNPQNPFYFSQRLKKATLILTEEEFNPLFLTLQEIKEKFGLDLYSLEVIERKLMSAVAIKVRQDDKVWVVPRSAVIRRLSSLDDHLDAVLKEKAKSIRWSNVGALDRFIPNQ